MISFKEIIQSLDNQDIFNYMQIATIAAMIFDIIFSFFIGYYQKGLLITNINKVFENYLK